MSYIKKTSATDNHHVELSLGQAQIIPLIIEKVIRKKFNGFSWHCSASNFYMQVDEIGLFSIENREKSYIQLKEGVTIQQALPFFYGTVLTVLLHMHFKFPIHASAVLSKSGLNLFCAASGTGKSTLAFNLFQRGYPLFSDDKCVLKWDKILKKYTAVPSIRAVRLWQDAMDAMDNPTVLEEGIPVIAKKDKFQYNLDGAMYDRIHMVNKIFVIRKVPNDKKLTIRLLNLKERQTAIRNQIHRPGLVIGEDIQKRHKQFVTNVARSVPIYFVQRPESTPIQDFVDFMQAQIGEPIK